MSRRLHNVNPMADTRLNTPAKTQSNPHRCQNGLGLGWGASLSERSNNGRAEDRARVVRSHLKTPMRTGLTTTMTSARHKVGLGAPSKRVKPPQTQLFRSVWSRLLGLPPCSSASRKTLSTPLTTTKDLNMTTQPTVSPARDTHTHTHIFSTRSRACAFRHLMSTNREFQAQRRVGC